MNNDRFIEYDPIFKKPDEVLYPLNEYKYKLSQDRKKQLEEFEKNEHKLEQYEKIIGSVIGFAVGDAIGVPVEFKSRDELKKEPISDMLEYGSHNQAEGVWSDDTSMVLATMDSINELKNINYEDIMKKFSEWYLKGDNTATGEVFDIGLTTKKAINKYISGEKFWKCGSQSFYENGNGALMRMLPLAIYFSQLNLSEKDKLEKIYYLTSLTHANEINFLGCRIYCDLFVELLNGKNIKEACQVLPKEKYEKAYDDSMIYYKRIFDGSILSSSEDEIKSTGYIVDTLEAAIWCLENSSNYRESILKAANLGGDTDTIAAITGSLATLIYGYENIPSDWETKLKLNGIIFDKSSEFLKTVLQIKKNNQLGTMFTEETSEDALNKTK